MVCTYLGIAGAGLGLLMQNLVLAAQNEFPRNQVGTVTSSNNFFREVGASLGTAVIGSVFAQRITEHLTASVSTKDFERLGDVDSLTPTFVRGLPTGLRDTSSTPMPTACCRSSTG